MKQTPLFTHHQGNNADLDVFGEWMLVRSYTDVQAEVDAIRDGVGVIDLADVHTIELHSPDARRWANGMFTNNVKRQVVGQGLRNAMCDDLGRVQGLIDLYMLRDDLLLGVLEGVSPVWFQERYRMFLMLDDIDLHTFSGEPWLLSVQGPDSEELLSTLGLPIPQRDVAEVPSDDGPGLRVLRRDRSGHDGFDLLVPEPVLGTLWEAARSAGATPCGVDAMEALRLSQSRARWPQDGNERSLVHELGLVDECVALNKGCYVGQEIITRVERKGQVQKRLTRLIMAEDALPPVGAHVLVDGQPVGTLSSAARVDGQVLALGVLRRPAWEPGTAVVVQAGDREVSARVG